jgi:hypothetical protein
MRRARLAHIATPGPPQARPDNAPLWPQARPTTKNIAPHSGRGRVMSHYFEKISTLKFDEIEKFQR